MTNTATPRPAEAPDELVRWIDAAERAYPRADWPLEAARLLGLAEVLVSDGANACLGEGVPGPGAAC